MQGTDVLIKRELLEQVASEFEHDTDRYMLGRELRKVLAAPQPSAVLDGFVLVPVEPTPEMVSAAEEAHMPFGDMDIALRMAILSAPSAPATAQSVNAQLLELLKWLRGSINCNTENDTGRHGVWFSTQHPMIRRIDAAIAAARKGEQ